MNKKVSIVVPVYNASSFIDKCVYSIINQTYKNIEIILIDDGSTDNSYEIIKEYEHHYNNIKTYTHKNMGASKTRNKGIEVSTGYYITFVDSDDYIDNDFIELLVNNIEENDAIFSGHKIVDLNGNIKKINKLDSSDWSKFKYMSTCSKLYKRDYLINNNLKYLEFKVCEDVCFNELVILSGASIKIISYCGYNYVNNNLSVTKSLNKKIDINETFTKLLKEINDRNYTYNKKYFSQVYLKNVINIIYMERKYVSIEELYDQLNTCILNINKDNKTYYLHYKLESFSIRLIYNIMLFSYKIKLNKFILFLLKI